MLSLHIENLCMVHVVGIICFIALFASLQFINFLYECDKNPYNLSQYIYLLTYISFSLFEIVPVINKERAY